MMKHQQIMLFFCLSLPACVFARVLQLLLTIDPATGFFVREHRVFGLLLFALVFVLCALTVWFAFLSHRNPEAPPQKSPVVAAASLLLGAAIAYTLLSESFAATVRPWQLTLLWVSGACSVLYLLGFALAMVVDFRFPPVFAVVLPFYLIVRIICTFTSVASLALISDNLFLLAGDCVLLLFFLSFGKLQNGLDEERNFKKLLAFGLAGVTLCFTQGLSHVLLMLLKPASTHHTPLAENLLLCAMGVFALTFLLAHFSAKNAAVVTHADS